MQGKVKSIRLMRLAGLRRFDQNSEGVKRVEETLASAIYKVLKDEGIDDKTKLERIETYIDVYFDNKQWERLKDALS